MKEDEDLRWKTENGQPQEKLVNVSLQFSHLLNAYTKAFNSWNDRQGSLFQNRFGRKEITSDAYFTRLVFYIHFNPQHHGLIEDFTDWPHSSYHSLLSKKKTNLHRDVVMEWFGGQEWYQNFHQENAAAFKLIAPFIEEDEF